MSKEITKELEPLSTSLLGSSETRDEESSLVTSLQSNYSIHHTLFQQVTSSKHKPEPSIWFYKNVRGPETFIAYVLGLLSILFFFLFAPLCFCCSLPLFVIAVYQRRCTIVLDDSKKELILKKHSILLPCLRKVTLSIPYRRVIRVLPFPTNVRFNDQEMFEPLIYTKDGPSVDSDVTLDYDSCKILCNEIWDHLLINKIRYTEVSSKV